jgi:hypothetical protein
MSTSKEISVSQEGESRVASETSKSKVRSETSSNIIVLQVRFQCCKCGFRVTSDIYG